MAEGDAKPRAPASGGAARGTVALGLGLIATGLAFASASLLVPGIALVALAAGATAWIDGAARSMRVQRLPGPAQVVEGEPYPLRLRVTRGPLPLPPAEVHDDLLEHPAALRARSPAQVSVAVSFPRRGRRALEPPVLHLRDPLGLCSSEVTGTGGGELLVLPRIEEVRRVSTAGGEPGLLDGLDQGDGGAGIETGAVDLELDGLRPYRPGSPASRIHWRTVARTGEMHERRFVAGTDAAPLVVLDASTPPSDAALDEAVRAAGSICRHLAVRGGCAILLPDRAMPTIVDPRLRTWADVHARLALVGQTAAPPQPRGTRGRVAVFWVGAAPAAQLARRVARHAPGSYVVTPVPAAGAPLAFTVAGCSAQAASRAIRPGARARRAA